MIRFILNDREIETSLPSGTTVLDFVRYHKNLTGTKIGCREGDCGACTILVGELNDDRVKYRSMTSCLMPLANAAGKHLVTVEGINSGDGSLTPAQAAMVDESGTQCGFCTVGFVMSLTGHALSEFAPTKESVVSAIDGNICRCTGYKSIERAAEKLCDTGHLRDAGTVGRGAAVAERIEAAIARGDVPQYFADIATRLTNLQSQFANRNSQIQANPKFVSGGTDLYVQRPEEMETTVAAHLFDDASLRFIKETEEFVEVGASTVVTDLLESDIFNRLFPNLYRHLKLVSSTPIRNMATLAGNFVNASPIGDMTAWFLALDAEIIVRTGSDGDRVRHDLTTASDRDRVIALRDFYLGYKKLAKAETEFVAAIRFRKDFTHFNFEKVCKRQYLDIASVNTAISLRMNGRTIGHAHVSVGGVFATPLYLKETSAFLAGRDVSEAVIAEAAAIMNSEIKPISDVRGTEEYKRLLARQLFLAHFAELGFDS